MSEKKEENSIATPQFINSNCRVDLGQLLKERTAICQNSNNNVHKTIEMQLIEQIYLPKLKKNYFFSKGNVKFSLFKKHCACFFCPDIIFKNIYDRVFMLRFIKEKEKAFEGSELENETIENEIN